MSEADSLRMVAEVVDKFSGPLRNLRSSLQGMSKDGGAHTKVLSDGLNKVEGAAKSAAQTATTVLNPALATIGVTGLGVTAALAGIQAAVRNFTTNASGLGQLGRDTGIAAEQLRDIQSVLGKVGIGANQSSAGIIAFAEAARQARGGVGPLMDFLRTQGKTTEGRAYFGGIADSLLKSKDAGDAFMKALKGLEGIKNPADRRVYAEQVLRMAEAARVVEKHRGTIDEQMAKANKEAGPLTPEMVQSAEAYDRAMSGLAATMKKIGTAIAMELEGPLAKVAVTMKGFLDDERKGVTPAIVTTIRETVAYIESVDWTGAFAKLQKGFGEVKTELGAALMQIRDMLREFGGKGDADTITTIFRGIGAAANSAATAIRSVAFALGALRDLKDGNLGGAVDNLDKLERNSLGIIKHRNAEPSKPTDAQTETMLGIITGGKPEDAAKAQRDAEAHRREQSKLTDEMRRLREALPDKKPGEATVQQQSFDASNPLAGLIQKASYGAMGAMAGVGNSMAGLGGRGLTAQGDPHAMDRFRAFLENRGYRGSVPEAMRGVGRALGEAGRQRQESYGGGAPALSGPFPNRNFGGGRFGGLGGSPLVTRPDGPADRVGRALRGEAPDGSIPSSSIAKNGGTKGDKWTGAPDFLANGAREAYDFWRSKGLTDEQSAGLVGMEQGESNFNAKARGDWTGGRPGAGQATAGGAFQWKNDRRQKILDNTGIDVWNSSHREQLEAAHWEMTQGQEKRFWGQITKGRTAAESAAIGVYKFERPKNKEFDSIRRGGFAESWLRRFRREDGDGRSATGDADRSKVGPEAGADFDRAKRFYGDKAEPGQLSMFSDPRFNDMRKSLRGMRRGKDGLGATNETLGALAEQRAKDDEDMRGIGKAFASINENGAMRRALKDRAGGRGDVNGNVSVFVAKPGPDTKVSTSASGNLFRDVKLNRGATMAQASQEN